MYYLEGNMVPTNMEYLFNEIKTASFSAIYCVWCCGLTYTVNLYILMFVGGGVALL